jgi:Lon protease-like protein
VSEPLAIFPLGTVLYPGLLLPLHIFEPRYRELVRDLVALPDGQDRRFGVVCIRAGREVGAATPQLHAVGCTAELTQVAELPDGRFDVVSVGGRRFRVGELDTERAYLRAEVQILEESEGDDAATTALVGGVAAAFQRYLTLLGEAGGREVSIPQLPSDPFTLGYLVAATMLLDLSDKQALLAAPDAVTRLGLELRLLRREIALLGVLPSAPAVELARVVASSN